MANEFAQYILKKQHIQSTAFEPQVSECYCDHHWGFKFVTPSDIRNKVKVQNFRNSAEPDAITPAFQGRSLMLPVKTSQEL